MVHQDLLIRSLGRVGLIRAKRLTDEVLGIGRTGVPGEVFEEPSERCLRRAGAAPPVLLNPDLKEILGSLAPRLGSRWTRGLGHRFHGALLNLAAQLIEARLALARQLLYGDQLSLDLHEITACLPAERQEQPSQSAQGIDGSALDRGDLSEAFCQHDGPRRIGAGHLLTELS
jgi:hypothetical protein